MIFPPLRLAPVAALLVLTGCASLPSSGPGAREILAEEASETNLMGFQIVDLEGAAPADEPAAAGALAALAGDAQIGLIGPGDVLDISIFEVGAGLFSGTTGLAGAAGELDIGARSRALPPMAVEADGSITLPYIGRLQVAGRTPGQVQDLIVAGLRGNSQEPQALVSFRENLTNSVMVMGAVPRAGRQPLPAARPKLLEAIAAAGGPAPNDGPHNFIVRLSRQGRAAEARLDEIRSGSTDDLALLPGDRIEIIRQPRSYTVFGAAGRVSQIAFESNRVSLAEATARAGGPNDSTADPSAVFVFRYEPGAAAPTPVIYRLNLLRPSGYFLAQNFYMHDKDVIYVANSPANQPTKLVQIVNLLFSPILTASQLGD